MKITTSFDNPPIGTRNCDWSAVTDNYDGSPECNDPIGRGATESEAIIDLLSQLPPGQIEHRSARVELLVPAEKAIRDAVVAVEAMPADERISSAVGFLLQARDAVARYVNEQVSA